MKRRTFLAIVTSAAIGAVAVIALSLSSPRSRPELKIVVGQERCSRCGMIVSDLRYAGGILVEGERQWRIYDDVGCLLLDYDELMKEGKAVESALVYDYLTMEPVPIDEANYVLADVQRLKTPMGYGIVALRRADEAREVASKFGGRIFSLREALEALEEVHHR